MEWSSPSAPTWRRGRCRGWSGCSARPTRGVMRLLCWRPAGQFTWGTEHRFARLPAMCGSPRSRIGRLASRTTGDWGAPLRSAGGAIYSLHVAPSTAGIGAAHGHRYRGCPRDLWDDEGLRPHPRRRLLCAQSWSRGFSPCGRYVKSFLRGRGRRCAFRARCCCESLGATPQRLSSLGHIFRGSRGRASVVRHRRPSWNDGRCPVLVLGGRGMGALLDGGCTWLQRRDGGFRHVGTAQALASPRMTNDSRCPTTPQLVGAWSATSAGWCRSHHASSHEMFGDASGDVGPMRLLEGVRPAVGRRPRGRSQRAF